ncbi:MAG: MotA/TolQ/ExbB proton channel family protein [Tepidisphaeraceae bacterium]
MRSLRSSRLLRLAVMLIVVGYMATAGLAQDAGAAPAGEKPKGLSVFSLILQNRDFVTYTIVALSIVALSLIIMSALRLRQAAFVPPAVVSTIRGMIEQRQFKELIDYTETDESFIGRTLNPALKRVGLGFEAMKEAMETAVGEQTAEQFRKIEYLNIIGNLGPLLGLLGTVLGMITAFSDMHASGGSAEPSTLADGIAKALAHTFMGLFLAVPSLAAFGVLRAAVDRLTIRAALVSEELLLMIRPSEAPAARQPGSGIGVSGLAGTASAPAQPRPPPRRAGHASIPYPNRHRRRIPNGCFVFGVLMFGRKRQSHFNKTTK